MTNNTPEVVAWYTPPARGTLPVVALNDRSQRGEPLIRLSDYEALQSECDTLVEALECFVEWYEQVNLRNEPRFQFYDKAKKALAAHRKRDSQPCPAIQEGYAGATVWIGDKRVTQVVTEGSLKHESEPGMAITHAAQACLDLLAAAHRKGEEL